MPLLSTRARAACSEPVGVRPTVGTVKLLGEDYTDMPGWQQVGARFGYVAITAIRIRRCLSATAHADR